MVKVLVVEDEASIREMIALNLRLAGMEAVEADSAEAALPLLEQRPGCDAAILDVMLPGMNGFSLCETIRRTDQKIGIIILSAKGQEQDKIRGLSIGADDYMTKPFSVSELLARVEALCRRVGRSAGAEAGEQAPASLVSGSFVLDENRRVLLKAGKPIELTQVEFQIMELFFRNPGVALVRERILKGVWGENYFGDVKIVDVNIRRLRMKVEDEPSHPAHILTVWGYGYRWEEQRRICSLLVSKENQKITSDFDALDPRERGCSPLSDPEGVVETEKASRFAKTGCGSQRLLRCRSHPAGRCPNSSSLFPPLAAVVAVALFSRFSDLESLCDGDAVRAK